MTGPVNRRHGTTGISPGSNFYHTMNSMISKQTVGAAALAATVLFSAGCEGTGPNTQRGAVGGAALGALAGAIIGNNSGGGGHALGGAAIGAVVGGLAGGALGNARDHETKQVYTSETQAQTNVVVQQEPTTPPPPPPPQVIVEQPSPRAVWIDGYWAYDGGGRYTWIAGHWVVPPGPYTYYERPHWRRTHRGYVYIQGYWR